MRQLLSPLKKSAQLLYLKQASTILCLGSPPSMKPSLTLPGRFQCFLLTGLLEYPLIMWCK